MTGRCAQEQEPVEFYLEHELAPTLKKADVVILDNLPINKSPRAEEIIRDRGAWMLFLPPYSPNLDPIEMAFATLEDHLRKAAVRSIDAICDSLTDICNMFDPVEAETTFGPQDMNSFERSAP